MSKIKEILNDPSSVLVFDIDGVLAVMEWGEYNHYGQDDETWAKMYEEKANYYTKEYVCHKMQQFLEQKNKNQIYVITKAFHENEAEDKRNFAFDFYHIPKDHVYYVGQNTDKTAILQKIKASYPTLDDHHLVMIDDTVEVLTDIMEKTHFSTAHISTFFNL